VKAVTLGKCIKYREPSFEIDPITPLVDVKMPPRVPRPLLLGHRGVRPLRRLAGSGYDSDVPAENTVAAFDYALANGCDGVEFDVRYTRDHRCVLCHDPAYNRKELASTAYADLDLCDANKLPCLEEVLRGFGGCAYLDIELKAPGNEEAVVAALHATPPQRGYVVSSFLPEVLLRIHEIDSSIPLGYVCKRADAAQGWTELPIKAFIPHHALVTPQLVEDAHEGGLHVITWTVNRKRDLLRLAIWGVDGLISDDPKLLAEVFPSARAFAAVS